MEQIAGFQAWQAVTKYASAEQIKDDKARFWQIVTLGISLDLIGCVIGAVIGFVGVQFFSSQLGLDENGALAAAIFILSLIFAISGTPIAVLRIYEHYTAISWILVFAAILKVALVVVTLVTGINIYLALTIYAGTMIAQHLTFVVLMFRIAKKEHMSLNFAGLTWRDFKKFPGMARFVSSVYLSTTFRYIAHELDTIILAAASGPAIAGQYKLAKQYGSIIFRAVEPAQQVLYPRIAAMVAAGQLQELARLISKIMLLSVSASCLLGLTYVLIGPELIRFFVGEGFDLVPMLLGIFLGAALIFCCFFFLRPLVLSFGRPDAILVIYIIATIVFLAGYFLLRDAIGPAAMMVAQIAFYATWAFGMSLTVYSAWRSALRNNNSVA